MPNALRPYQETALQAIKESVWAGVRRLMVMAPTGSGKTLLAAAIAQGCLRKGNKLIFVVPLITLIDQTLEKFAAEGIDCCGVIQGNHPAENWSMPIQIASIQTIRSRGIFPAAAVVCVDEAHVLHKEHIRWMGRLGDPNKGEPKIIDAAPGWENKIFIGLSATPWASGLGRFFETLLTMSTTNQLIQEGFLSKYRILAPDRPDLSAVTIRRGDYVESELSAAMQNAPGLTANIIETWRLRWGKPKTLVFAVDRAHARMIVERFAEANVPVAYQDAKTPPDERREIKRKFHNEEIYVVVNILTLGMGADWDCRCLILARPTRSEMLFVQIIGRCLRPANGKTAALILDHSDTTLRMGMPSDIYHEHLSSGRFDQKTKIIRKPRLPKPCTECGFLIPPGLMKCPECGHTKKLPETEVFEKPGELVEFTGGWRMKHQRDEKRFPYTWQEKQRFFAQLKGYGIQQGYQPGWTSRKFLEKFGDWPPWSWRESVTAMQPGPEVMAYIKYTLIRWANSKYRDDGSDRPKA